MNLLGFFQGMRQVAVQEFLVNLRSLRLIIMALVAALVVVGGAYGISGFLGGGGPGGGLPPLVPWSHAAYAANGSRIVVVWVSDPFGAPSAGSTVDFGDLTSNGTSIFATTQTDSAGFARSDVGARDNVYVGVRSGSYRSATTVYFPAPPENFTVSSLQADFDRDGVDDEMGLHVLDRSGDLVSAEVSVNGTVVGDVDSHGYLLIDLPAGQSTVNVTVAGETRSMPTFVYEPRDGGPTFRSGPDIVLSIIAALSGFIVSLFAIILSFDAVSKERVQGTMDLLLSRPASRTGILLGKFLGSFAAVALPVTLVNLGGIGVISAVSGKSPTGSFAAVFLGLSLLLIAIYVLVGLIFSTFAKSSGTAILFGVMVWLLFNLLYPILVFILGGILFGNDPASYFRFQQVAGLGSPTQVYVLLIQLASPQNLGGAGGTAIDPILPESAAVFWVAFLLFTALWTFHRRGAE